MNAQVNQEELLVARNKKRYQEICLRIHQVSTEQSATHEESRRTLSTGNIGRTMVRN